MPANKTKTITWVLIGVLVLALAVFLYYSIDNQPELTEEPGLEEETEEVEETGQTGVREEFPAPEDIIDLNSFETDLSQLNNSHKLVATLNNYFDWEERSGFQALEPAEFYERRLGSEQDLAAFTAYSLYRNGFIAFVFTYRHEDDQGRDSTHFGVAFREDEQPKYIFLDEDRVRLVHYGWSFEDLCRFEESRLGGRVVSYGTVSPQATDLTPEKWINR